MINAGASLKTALPFLARTLQHVPHLALVAAARSTPCFDFENKNTFASSCHQLLSGVRQEAKTMAMTSSVTDSQLRSLHAYMPTRSYENFCMLMLSQFD
jgi:hypothetical protein